MLNEHWKKLWGQLRDDQLSEIPNEVTPNNWRAFYPSDEHLSQLKKLLSTESISHVYYLGLADELVIRAVLDANPKCDISVFDYYGVSQTLSTNSVGTSGQTSILEREAMCDRILWISEGVRRKCDLYILDIDEIPAGALATLRGKYMVLFGQSPLAPIAELYRWDIFGDMSIGTRICDGVCDASK